MARPLKWCGQHAVTEPPCTEFPETDAVDTVAGRLTNQTDYLAEASRILTYEGIRRFLEPNGERSGQGYDL